VIRSWVLAASLALSLPQGLRAGQVLALAERPARAPALAQVDLLPDELPGAVGHSLAFLAGPEAARQVRPRGDGPFSLDRVRRTLERFRDLQTAGLDRRGFLAAVRDQFEFHPAAGDDRAGGMVFTGYFEPVYDASRTPTDAFRYPLYRRPPDFQAWPRPHPTRLELVGLDGLQGGQGPLKGLELAWLKDRFQAFLVEVQGSARLRLPGGETMTVGNDGVTDHPYVSIGRLLAADGRLSPDRLGLASIAAYFQDHPEHLGPYLARCSRMAFFRDTRNGPPGGSLQIPITAQCSVAADPDLFPPVALALIELDLPGPDGSIGPRKVQRLVLVQDTGGAIKGPGRLDYFLGSGPEAGAAAGRLHSRGRAWFLLVKEEAPEDEDD